MKKKIAIVQSNYIPWKGYFDMIAYADEFVLLDDVQFTRRDWRNRNKIKTPQGLLWLTVPVEVKGKFLQRINETMISGTDWAGKHLKSLEANYRKTPFFTDVMEWLSPLYRERERNDLSTLNRQLIEAINAYIGISTPLRSSSEFTLSVEPTERLLDICLQCEATHYISGPAAQSYLDVARFEAKNIDVEWFSYSGYSEYEQLWGTFEHGVSILDLLFNEGKASAGMMKHVKKCSPNQPLNRRHPL